MIRSESAFFVDFRHSHKGSHFHYVSFQNANNLFKIFESAFFVDFDIFKMKKCNVTYFGSVCGGVFTKYFESSPEFACLRCQTYCCPHCDTSMIYGQRMHAECAQKGSRTKSASKMKWNFGNFQIWISVLYSDHVFHKGSHFTDII